MLQVIIVVLAVIATASARSLQGRIVGGRDASIDEFPYQVSLEFLGAHRCGGSLIATDVVLTAAHCVDNLHEYVKYFQVRAGTSKSNSKEGQTAQVERIHQHPQFTESYDFDIAILVLKSRFVLGDTIQVISIITPEHEVEDGEIAYATGWGAVRQGGRGSVILQAVEVPKINFEICADVYTTLTDRMICYGYSDGGKDACQGDSGGPLVHAIGGKLYLAGVVSWGDGCAKKGFPGVYADIMNVKIYEYVSEFLD